MTDQERDELLLRLERKVDALADLPPKVDRILEGVQGLAGARVGTDERIAALERRVADLERAGGAAPRQPFRRMGGRKRSITEGL